MAPIINAGRGETVVLAWKTSEKRNLNLTLGRNLLDFESKGDQKTFQTGEQQDKIMEVWGEKRSRLVVWVLGFFCFCFCFAVQQHHKESEFPNRGWNLFPLRWKHGVLTTGPPRSPKTGILRTLKKCSRPLSSGEKW